MFDGAHDLKMVTELPRDTWSEFVYDHPNGNIFQTPEMNDVWENIRNHEPYLLALVDKDEKIHGLLQGVIQKVYDGFWGEFTARSIFWGGPLISNDSIVVLEVLLEKYDSFIKSKAIYTEIRNIFKTDNTKHIFGKFRFKFEDHLDILINLDKPENVLWSELHTNRRKQINRGYRRGTRFLFVDKPDEKIISECYEIIAILYKKIRLPVPDKYFFLTSFSFLNENIGLFVLKYQDRIIGCRFVLLYKNMIYDWYAGSLDQFLDKYPNDILPWEVIKWGTENGYKIFDFGGAGKPGIPYGVRDYKLKFGGELLNFGRYEKVHKPMMMKLGKLGFKIWKKIR